MVSKTDQVLLAMLALGDFTADELSRFSRVLPATVRTTIARKRHLLDPVSTELTGRRGGQRTRHRLSENGRQQLSAQLAKAHEVLAPPPTLPNRLMALLPLTARHMPPGLRVADDTLNRLYPAAQTDQERLDLLEAAENELHDALRAVPGSDPAVGEQIRKAVSHRMEKITSQRKALEEELPLLALPEIDGIGIQIIWSNVRPALAHRIARDLEENAAAQVLVSEAPPNPMELTPVGDAMLLLVDSNKKTEARKLVDGAVQVMAKAEKPMAVFDTGYDSTFRNYVLGTGVASFYNDAAAINASGVKSIVGNMLEGAGPKRTG